MKLYEIHFSFSPSDPEGIGEGLITVEAESKEEAEDNFESFMEDVPDVSIIEIREVVEIPEGANFTPRTLN